MNATGTAIAVFVNDRPHALEGPCTLAGLLRDLGLADRRGIAAAINGEVVPRAGWPGRTLADGDRILVIRATQGG